jgi:hypothetical protein
MCGPAPSLRICLARLAPTRGFVNLPIWSTPAAEEPTW